MEGFVTIYTGYEFTDPGRGLSLAKKFGSGTSKMVLLNRLGFRNTALTFTVPILRCTVLVPVRVKLLSNVNTVSAKKIATSVKK
jgi:hypothetical protein